MIVKGRDGLVPCPRCQGRYREDDPMCPHCGYPLPDTRPADEQTPTDAPSEPAPPEPTQNPPPPRRPEPARGPVRLPDQPLPARLAVPPAPWPVGRFALVAVGLLLIGVAIWAAR